MLGLNKVYIQEITITKIDRCVLLKNFMSKFKSSQNKEIISHRFIYEIRISINPPNLVAALKSQRKVLTPQ